MRRDYYAVLGIAATADTREIRQAFRRLARRYSPDVNFWDAEARALFEEISAAYRVLSDPGARSMYDRYGCAIADGLALAAGRRGEDLHVTVSLALITFNGQGPGGAIYNQMGRVIVTHTTVQNNSQPECFNVSPCGD